MDYSEAINQLNNEWKNSARWQGIQRTYDAKDVFALRGSLKVEYTLAQLGAKRLWELLHEDTYIKALGALTGNQAIQQVTAGLKAIYISGWQVAADANNWGQMYPDLSLYPVDSVPNIVRKINSALQRADQVHHMEGNNIDWFVPLVADAEAGFGGVLNTFELMKALIEAGAGGVHLEDQLSALKKCGHMGGKVLVPAQEFIDKLVAARLAADVLGVPTVLIARTDANSSYLIRSDYDPIDQPFLDGARTSDGFFAVKGGLEFAIARALAYAPYADMLWCETSRPDIGEAREFAQEVLKKFPGKRLAYNCSPSFNWKGCLRNDKDIAEFQDKLGEMGYKFQFVTLAGFHTLNTSMFVLAHGYNKEGMKAYSRLQEEEFFLEKTCGYRAVRHQSFVGAGYFDKVQTVVSQGNTKTTALHGSTEEEQFGDQIHEHNGNGNGNGNPKKATLSRKES